MNLPDGWNLFADATLHLQLAYPPDYTLWTTDISNEPVELKALLRFAPKDIDLNKPDLIVLPSMTVRVYDNPHDLNLHQWIAQSGLHQPNNEWISEPYQLNTMMGLRLSATTFIAPGEYIYLQAHGTIYQFIPADSVGQRMLTSIMLNP